jgi:hypothetical protein
VEEGNGKSKQAGGIKAKNKKGKRLEGRGERKENM